MTKKICLIGSPGCGKSTLAAELFVTLKKMGKNTELVPEWVRRSIQIHGPMTNVLEQYRTLLHHRKAEEYLPPEVEYAIIDSGTVSMYFYAAVYSKKQDQKERLVVQDMYEALLDDLYSKRYDWIYFLPRAPVDATGAIIQDGVRYQSQDDLQVLEDYMSLLFTKIHNIDNIKVLDCLLGQRVDLIINDLLHPARIDMVEPISREEAWFTAPIDDRGYIDFSKTKEKK
jgi:nicotinamide riboside kinase